VRWLVCKILTLGALAMGDVWFGGVTRNPWNTNQGSSGSSAGPASATAGRDAWLFSIGSETLGSISSPSTRCGLYGLRPSFGPSAEDGRDGALLEVMDKLGPICRTVEDCALVLDAILRPGWARSDRSPAAFNWDSNLNWRKLRVGYLKAAFERKPDDQQEAAKEEPPATPEEQKEAGGAEETARGVARASRVRQKIQRRSAGETARNGRESVPVDMPEISL